MAGLYGKYWLSKFRSAIWYFVFAVYHSPSIAITMLSLHVSIKTRCTNATFINMFINIFILPRLWYTLLSCGLKQVWSSVVYHYRVYLHYISGTVWCVVYGTCAQRWSYRKFHLYFWLYWETVNESKNWASRVCWLTRHSEHHCYQGYQFGQLRSKNFWVHFSCCGANRSDNRRTEEVTTIQPTERE